MTREILRELSGMGKTILVSSHILSELAEICTGVGIIDRGRLLRSGTIDEIERSLRATALLRIELVGDDAARVAAAELTRTDPRVGDVMDGADHGSLIRLEVAFDGDADAQADLLRTLVEAGHRVVGFSQATSDLEEIFLKVTGQGDEGVVG